MNGFVPAVKAKEALGIIQKHKLSLMYTHTHKQ